MLPVSERQSDCDTNKQTNMFALCVVFLLAAASAAAPPINLLFVVSDDLRPEIGAYTNGRAYTPNLDRLASEGTIFKRAYCQAPICAPSRTSFMTGRRPEHTGVFTFRQKFSWMRETVMQGRSGLSTHLHDNGYYVYWSGKINGMTYPEPLSHSDHLGTWYDEFVPAWDMPDRTTRDPYIDCRRCNGSWYYTREAWRNGECTQDNGAHFAKWCEAPVDAPHTDRILTDKAVATLQGTQQPFAMFLGYRSPHTDFRSPEGDTARVGNVSLPLLMSTLPLGVASHNVRWWNTKVHNLTDPAVVLSARLHYAAAALHVDDQVGRLVDALDTLGLAGNTLVVFTSDHGYLLGEYGMWHKGRLLELAARVPLIFRGPNVTSGRVVPKVVEMVDIFPTVSDLLGLQRPTPAGDGVSLLPVPPRKRAYTIQVRCEKGVPCGQSTVFSVMGLSVRDASYRYSEWLPWDNETGLPVARDPREIELYNYTGVDMADFDAFDHENVVNTSAAAPIVADMQARLYRRYDVITVPARLRQLRYHSVETDEFSLRWLYGGGGEVHPVTHVEYHWRPYAPPSDHGPWQQNSVSGGVAGVRVTGLQTATDYQARARACNQAGCAPQWRVTRFMTLLPSE